MTEERSLASDTALVAERKQFEIWRGMTPREKFAVFIDLQATAIALAEAGIRLRYPAAGPHEVFLRRVARHLDRSTMMSVYDWDPDQHR